MLNYQNKESEREKKKKNELRVPNFLGAVNWSNISINNFNIENVNIID